MAKNLFDKYGIKEVADVTFFRIEQKDEVYEAQRTVTASSILQGAVKLHTVYPLNEDGRGAEEGFEAYVFEDARILTHTKYDHKEAETVEIDNTALDDESYPVSDDEGIALLSEGGDIVASGKKEDDEPGSHEYSYEQQLLMLFAKNQNLIKKTGVRYSFSADEEQAIFGNLSLSDKYAVCPESTERVVVLELTGKVDYDIEEINEAIKNNTYSLKAKAYDVAYKDYTELLVEDEMGYYLAGALFSDKALTAPYAKNTNIVKDNLLANAEQWTAPVEEGEVGCKSINDAIDALRQKKVSVDTDSEVKTYDINSVSGGYNVSNPYAKKEQDTDASETVNSENGEGWKVLSDTESETLSKDFVDTKGRYRIGTEENNTTSLYTLQAVLEELLNVNEEMVEDGNLNFTPNGEESNRAIYVRVGSAALANPAYIYLLTNVNQKALSKDDKGIFWFKDRKGNKVYYQDKNVFCGVEYLALVVIGNQGIIFRVGRHGVKKIDKVAWMINDAGYATNDQCQMIVKNGIIHTVDVTVNDETFDATCSVKDLKIRKVEKRVNRYVPVLFLDTLKVSTIEQTAESTYATGGKGNAQLIGWDYGKEITVTLEDALYTPASMSAMLGSYEGNDFTSGVKETKRIDRTEKCVAKRSFIVPAGNSEGTPSEGVASPQAVYIDLHTMKPYQDGSPIAEGEVYLKWTRSIAYDNNSLGNTIEISAEKFPGTYKVVGETFARSEATGEDQRFQFVIPKAKVSPESNTITLEAEGDPTVFSMTLKVLRPEDGIMMKLIQYDVVENTEENDGSTMVKDTENLNLLEDAEMFRLNSGIDEDENAIGATEY